MLGAVVVYFFLYESSGLSLESVDMVGLVCSSVLAYPAHLFSQMYTDPKCKPWTSSTWAPAGYADRKELEEQVSAAEAQKPLAGGFDEERKEVVGQNGAAGNNKV